MRSSERLFPTRTALSRNTSICTTTKQQVDTFIMLFSWIWNKETLAEGHHIEGAELIGRRRHARGVTRLHHEDFSSITSTACFTTLSWFPSTCPSANCWTVLPYSEVHDSNVRRSEPSRVRYRMWCDHLHPTPRTNKLRFEVTCIQQCPFSFTFTSSSLVSHLLLLARCLSQKSLSKCSMRRISRSSGSPPSR